MSDERDDADAAADGEAEDHGGRTAVVTRPQRPTGKRSRQRVNADDTDDESSSGAVELTESAADDEAGKKAKKARTSGAQSTNPIVYVYHYLKQVIAELRKVIWPNRKQMGTYTSVVLAFLIFMVALIGLVDLGLAKLVLVVFG
ncbi:preprotein translocase subunit SecE [Candidatus Mycobacterium methanotrophicum]|uniref:Protein translocase subunit SecE n=1 Tax=Candidatus Mycobacterium methanotrophicum TaxID=2943498 RepID=A0ABY4QM10_9MYCO|nr:preprotein translocase subunit SecE [Candidatus Mycobacterium methanotrophicum]UQX11537.1 preprotein translocase subunit SecE [Candidatus Mycobacterium methanotrophicum]